VAAVFGRQHFVEASFAGGDIGEQLGGLRPALVAWQDLEIGLSARLERGGF